MMLDRAFYNGREKCNDDILRDCENANRRPSSMDDEKCDNNVLKDDENADGRLSSIDDGVKSMMMIINDDVDPW